MVGLKAGDHEHTEIHVQQAAYDRMKYALPILSFPRY